MSYERIAVNQPSWQSVMVTRHLPAEINGLERLSKNLWWCWNEDAKALFKLIDEDVWHRSGHNPMDVLDTVSLKHFKVLAYLSPLTSHHFPSPDFKPASHSPSYLFPLLSV